MRSILFLLGCTVPASGQQPSITTLGFLGDHDPTGLNGGVSDTGVVVGQLDGRAFSWSAVTGILDLGSLPGGDSESAALDISADSEVIVGYAATAVGEQPFRWTEETGMVSLGGLPGGTGVGRATATNADGSAVTGWTEGPDGFEAFYWTIDGGLVGLGELPGGSDWSLGYGLSQDGLTVVGEAGPSPGTVAFRWTADEGMVSLHQPGYAVTRARAVSADGRTIIGMAAPGFTGEAYAARWTSSGGFQLMGQDDCDVTNLSADGAIAIGHCFIGSKITYAATWGPSLTWSDPFSYLANEGVDLSYWDCPFFANVCNLGISDVSPNGRYLAGTGGTTQGTGEQYLIDTVGGLVPPISTEICAPAVPNSTGVPATLEARGSSEATDNVVILEARDVPPSQFGIFFISDAPAAPYIPRDSVGAVCLASPLARYSAAEGYGLVPTDEEGRLRLVLDLYITPQPGGPIGILAGESWYFQAWYRDPAGGVSNLTNAVRVDFR